MNPLDYHKPEPPKPQARPGFRFGAWVLFLLSLAPLAGGCVSLMQRDYETGFVLVTGAAPGCLMFGSIAISGRLPGGLMRKR